LNSTTVREYLVKRIYVLRISLKKFLSSSSESKSLIGHLECAPISKALTLWKRGLCFAIMKILKIENVLLTAKNIDESVSFFSGLLGIEFERRGHHILPDGMEVNIAISSLGVELVEQLKPRLAQDGMRGISLRVADLKSAREEMKQKGFEPIVEFEIPNLKEAIYIIRGMRLALEEHLD